MNDWSVSAYFPEIRPAHLAEQSIVVRASSLATAARLGLDEIRARDAMRGKKITVAKITISMCQRGGK